MSNPTICCHTFVHFTFFLLEFQMEALGPEELVRYKEKIEDIGGRDPYKISPQLMSKDPTILPSISYPDIVNYLI